MKKWVSIIIFLASFVIVFRLADNMLVGIIMGIFWGLVVTIAFRAIIERGDEKEKNKEAKETFRNLLKSAENGNPEAQLGLGCIYTHSGKRDIAFEWLLKSAEQGNSEAQWRLAVCFGNGEGTKENQKKALLWAKKSADHGNAEGELLYSQYSDSKIMHDIFSNISEENPVSPEAMTKLHSSDSSIRMEALALMNSIKNEENEEEYYSRLLAGAKLNIPFAQYIVGIMYYTGIFSIEKNLKEAFNLFSKSAEQGYADAQIALSICYECGKGVENNNDKAFEWAKKSAEQGNLEAQLTVASCYDQGIGTEVNREKHKYWTKKIIENNDLKDDSLKEIMGLGLKMRESKNKLETQSNA